MEIGIEAAQFPEKEYINGIFVAVCISARRHLPTTYTYLKPNLRQYITECNPFLQIRKR